MFHNAACVGLYAYVMSDIKTFNEMHIDTYQFGRLRWRSGITWDSKPVVMQICVQILMSVDRFLARCLGKAPNPAATCR